MNAAVAVDGGSRSDRLGLRLLIVVGAVALVGLCLAGVSLLIAPGVTAPPRSPFGVGFREAQPAVTGLGGWLLALQSGFSRSLQAAVAAIRDGGGWAPMILLGLSYGIVHAAGPGHGKAVIAGYIVAGEGALRRGLTLSFAAALLQALVAIAIVAIGAGLIGVTAAGMTRAGTAIETASFVLVAILGLVLTWRKAGGLAASIAGVPPSACAPGCGHLHLHDAAATDRPRTWREQAGVVLAAGSRPCAGAVLILVFCATQGMMAAGVAATLAMALGTALTTSALASLAVFAKGAALRLAGGRGRSGTLAVGSLEVVAGAFVLILGITMLLGLASGGAA